MFLNHKIFSARWSQDAAGTAKAQAFAAIDPGQTATKAEAQNQNAWYDVATKAKTFRETIQLVLDECKETALFLSLCKNKYEHFMSESVGKLVIDVAHSLSLLVS